MDDVVKDVIPLLQYLIPGFLAAWIFYSLTAFKKPDSFGQVVQALIFTFVIHGVVGALGWGLTRFGYHVFAIGPWGPVAQALCAFFVAVLLGLTCCYIVNSDSIHWRLRNRRITLQTSHPSQWHSTFSKLQRYIVLHLADERRLYGWPLEWPPDPSMGQFVMYEPSWLDNNGVEMPTGAEVLLVDVSKIQWVEFAPPQTGISL